jgi:hypothetical protein
MTGNIPRRGSVLIDLAVVHLIDPQASGPQLFYGLRYHTHIVKPGEIETLPPIRIVASG